MSLIAIISSSIIFVLSSYFTIIDSIQEHKYLKDFDMFSYLWFISMDWILICGCGIGLCICMPILIFI